MSMAGEKTGLISAVSRQLCQDGVDTCLIALHDQEGAGVAFYCADLEGDVTDLAQSQVARNAVSDFTRCMLEDPTMAAEVTASVVDHLARATTRQEPWALQACQLLREVIQGQQPTRYRAAPTHGDITPENTL